MKRTNPGRDPNAALALRLMSCMNVEDEDEGETNEWDMAEKHQRCVEALARALMDSNNEFDENTLRTYLTQHSGYEPDVVDLYIAEALRKTKDRMKEIESNLGISKLTNSLMAIKH